MRGRRPSLPAVSARRARPGKSPAVKPCGVGFRGVGFRGAGFRGIGCRELQRGTHPVGDARQGIFPAQSNLPAAIRRKYAPTSRRRHRSRPNQRAATTALAAGTGCKPASCPRGHIGHRPILGQPSRQTLPCPVGHQIGITERRGQPDRDESERYAPTGITEKVAPLALMHRTQRPRRCQALADRRPRHWLAVPSGTAWPASHEEALTVADFGSRRGLNGLTEVMAYWFP
jgi:hypothetical protein